MAVTPTTNWSAWALPTQRTSNNTAPCSFRADLAIEVVIQSLAAASAVLFAFFWKIPGGANERLVAGCVFDLLRALLHVALANLPVLLRGEVFQRYRSALPTLHYLASAKGFASSLLYTTTTIEIWRKLRHRPPGLISVNGASAMTIFAFLYSVPTFWEYMNVQCLWPGGQSSDDLVAANTEQKGRVLGHAIFIGPCVLLDAAAAVMLVLLAWEAHRKYRLKINYDEDTGTAIVYGIVSSILIALRCSFQVVSHVFLLSISLSTNHATAHELTTYDKWAQLHRNAENLVQTAFSAGLAVLVGACCAVQRKANKRRWEYESVLVSNWENRRRIRFCEETETALSEQNPSRSTRVPQEELLAD